jgi:hypothetical protein
MRGAVERHNCRTFTGARRTTLFSDLVLGLRRAQPTCTFAANFHLRCKNDGTKKGKHKASQAHKSIAILSSRCSCISHCRILNSIIDSTQREVLSKLATMSAAPPRCSSIFDVAKIMIFMACLAFQALQVFRSSPSPSTAVTSSSFSKRNSDDEIIACEDGLEYIEDSILPPAAASYDKTIIPRIIHMTARERCVAADFFPFCEEWSNLPGYSYSFWNDIDVDAFLAIPRPEFPHLQNVLHCLPPEGSVAKADLFRYLLIWDYGGVYTDLDTSPVQKGWANMKNDQELLVLVDESDGILEPFFLAAKPKHPLMYLTVLNALQKLTSITSSTADDPIDVGAITGRQALQGGLLTFLRWRKNNMPKTISEGTYVGVRNATITVLSAQKAQGTLVKHASIISPENKRNGYQAMGMTLANEMQFSLVDSVCHYHLHHVLQKAVTHIVEE